MALTRKSSGPGKTEAARKKAQAKSLLKPQAGVRDLPSRELTPASATTNAVIFGNCLFDGEDGYYYMWTSCDSNEACGEDCIWSIPYECAVAGTVICYCADGCPAWAVEISC